MLPVVLAGLPLYALLRGTPRAEARDHRACGGKEEGEHVWGQARRAALLTLAPSAESQPRDRLERTVGIALETHGDLHPRTSFRTSAEAAS